MGYGDYPGAAPNYSNGPLCYGYTVGTTVTALVGQNPYRRKLIIHNPNPVAFVGIAPSTNAATGASLVPIVGASGAGGAGTTIIVPFGSVTMDSSSGCGNNFNAITDTSGATVTVWEFV